MCGIVAYVEALKVNANDDAMKKSEAMLQESLNMINHRGPDGQGIYVASQVGLGHVRLAVMDPEHGQQPLYDQEETVFVVANGEFYEFESIRKDLQSKGHKFKTTSDCEILVHLYKEYGMDMFNYLQGEFAFCLWDAKSLSLICARDRFGIKPLFFSIFNDRLHVASEIKALLPMGLKAQWDMPSIVNAGVFSDDRTLFKGVSKVKPGHYMVYSASKTLDMRQYWQADYPDRSIVDKRTEEEMIQGVRQRLTNAVRKRLRADVPVGVYLSGGIDSSCVLGIATEMLRESKPDAKLDAFTISFGDEQYNESDIAERTARHAQANFHKLVVTEDDLAHSFEEFAWHTESPFCDLNGIAKFLLSKFVQEKGIKCVLTGEGADEHFGGYSFLKLDYLRDDNEQVPSTQRLGMLKAIESNPQTLMAWSCLGAYDFSNDDCKLARKMLDGIITLRILATMAGCATAMFTPQALDAAGTTDCALTFAKHIDGVNRAKAKSKWHHLHTAMFVTTNSLLPNYLCNHLGDRSEMAHSVEARTPFLDHHLTEYVNGLPPSVKFHGPLTQLTDKWILRQSVQPYVTPEIYGRPKVPFLAPPSIPDPTSVYCQLLHRLLTPVSIGRLGFVQWSFVQGAMDDFMKTGNRKSQNALHQLMSLAVIADRFKVETWKPHA